MERFVITVNGWKPVIIITKRSILDVAAALDPPLHTAIRNKLANKCLNVRERPGIAESSKVAPTFFCCPVNRQWLEKNPPPQEKKTNIEIRILSYYIRGPAMLFRAL